MTSLSFFSILGGIAEDEPVTWLECDHGLARRRAAHWRHLALISQRTRLALEIEHGRGGFRSFEAWSAFARRTPIRSRQHCYAEGFGLWRDIDDFTLGRIVEAE